jgi:hypothetical protein
MYNLIWVCYQRDTTHDVIFVVISFLFSLSSLLFSLLPSPPLLSPALFSLFFFLFFLETGSCYVAKTDLKFMILLLSLPSAGIIGMYPTHYL